MQTASMHEPSKLNAIVIRRRNVVIYVRWHEKLNASALKGLQRVADVLDSYIDNFTRTINATLTEPINITILSPVLARGYGSSENPIDPTCYALHTDKGFLFAGPALSTMRALHAC